jgi:hypothetical protein
MTSRRISAFASAALLAAIVLASPIARAESNIPVPPQELMALGTNATFHTDMTFDESMLQAASQVMPDEDKPIVAKLRSITVHTFRYSAPGMYDPAALEAVRAQFDADGWNHMVVKQPHAPTADATASDPNAAPGVAARPTDPWRTEMWVRMQHANVDGVVLLVANEKNVNLIVIDGMISPLDLLHLRGHFGIPRFHGDEVDKDSQ